MSTFKLGSRTLENMKHLHPKLMRVNYRAIQLTTQDFGCPDKCVRTAEEQNALYQQGRKTPGKIVTHADGYKVKSNHQIDVNGYGYAEDLVPYVDGSYKWDNTYKLHIPIAVAMAQAAREMSAQVQWGGNWYETINSYLFDEDDAWAAIERYKKAHPGPDFIDVPHFQLLG